MHGKWAIAVTLFAVGCGQALTAGPGDTDGGPDAQTGSEGGHGDASPSADGSSTGDAGEDARVDATGGDASPDASSRDAETDAAKWSPECPATAPIAGAACSIDGLQCEYPRLKYLYQLQYDVACDIVVQCTGGTWGDVSITPTACNPDSANSTACPAKFDDIQNGGSCPASDKGLRCEYAAGVCVCAAALGGPVTVLDAGVSWGCDPGSGCPMPRPRLGSACSTGQTCTYETCAFAESCAKSGVWQGVETACAVSQQSP